MQNLRENDVELIMLLVVAAFALAPPQSVTVTPLRLSRLLLPVYSSEHLLQLGRDSGDCDSGDCDGRVLPVLLRYSEGERLERVNSPMMPLALECVARRQLFEQAGATELSPWALWALADGCSNLAESLLRFLASKGWTATAVVLTLESAGVARYREDPSVSRSRPLRPFELVARLQCTRNNEATLALELDGPGEAVLCSRQGGLPLLIAAETWADRAVESERLPEVSGACIDLSALLVAT